MRFVTQKVIGKLPGARCQWGNGLGGFEVIHNGKSIAVGKTKTEAWFNAAKKIGIIT